MRLIISTDTINDVYWPFWSNESIRWMPTQIYYGGGSSGKSVDVARRTIEDIMRYDRNFLVVRQILHDVRRSIFNELCDAVSFLQVNHLFHIRSTDMQITCKLNGCQAVFAGLDNPERLKSIRPEVGVFTDLLIEEATEISQDAYRKLRLRLRGLMPPGHQNRPKRFILIFNPIYKNHWIYKTYFNHFARKNMDPELGKIYKIDNKVVIIRVNHWHNKFLSSDDRERYEEMKEDDPYLYQVYGLGEWGILGSMVFRFSVQNLSGIEDRVSNVRNGLDFGFEAPSAFSRSARAGRKKMYIYDEFYHRDQTNQQLAKLIYNKIGNNELVTCDSAEPKSVQELVESPQQIRARGAVKGPDSVRHGIQWLNTFDTIIDENCQAHINELSLFRRKEDKDGNIIPDKYLGERHAIDAWRYAWSYDMDYKKSLIVTRRDINRNEDEDTYTKTGGAFV